MVKIPKAYLASMCPKQMSSHFRISPYHSPLTMLETVQILHVKYMPATNTLPAPHRPQIKAASREARDGQRGVKVMCPLWQVEDGETRAPQLHPVPGCRGEGRGWTHRQTDRHLQKNTTHQNCGRCLIKLPFPEKLSLGKQNCLKHVHH